MRIRAKITNAADVGAAFSDAARTLDSGSREMVQQLGADGRDFLRYASPSAPGNPLWEGIRFRSDGKTVNFTIHAYDPESGYDYAAVTRFGHRVEYITPVSRKALLIGASRGFSPAGDDRAANRDFRAWVPGYDPAEDWVDSGWTAILQEAEDQLGDLGDKVELRVHT